MKYEHLKIRWITRNKHTIARIRERFDITNHTTVNGISFVSLKEVDRAVFEETAKKGFFAIMRKNG